MSAKGTGVFNLWERDFATGKDQRLTNYTDQMVMFPSLSADGKWLVFRKGLDFYRYDTMKRTPPERIDLWATPEDVSPDEIRRVLGRATNVTFSADGLEVAFIAGGNLWVMDTVLRELRRVTATESADDEPIFVNKDQEILFLRNTGNGVDLWRATRLNPAQYWWQNEGFKVERLTTDGQEKSNLTPSPDGSKIAWVQGLGTCWVRWRGSMPVSPGRFWRPGTRGTPGRQTDVGWGLRWRIPTTTAMSQFIPWRGRSRLTMFSGIPMLMAIPSGRPMAKCSPSPAGGGTMRRTCIMSGCGTRMTRSVPGN